MVRWRREGLPSEALRSMGLAAGERVLAHAVDPDGRIVGATTAGVRLQRRPPAYDLVPWHEIERAGFADDVLTLRLVGSGTSVLRIPLPSPGRVPEVVRDRVTASVVFDQHVALRGRTGVRVIARRLPDGASLTWGYRTDDGLDLTSAEEEEARAAVAAARAEYE